MELKPNRKKIYATIGFVLATTFFSDAQNLVYNGSFEDIASCPSSPNGTNQIPLAAPWIPLNNSPNLFNSCFNNMLSSACWYVSVPDNLGGYSNALSGNGYAGIVTYNASAQIREYITQPLSSPLIPGKAYKVECYVKRAYNGRWATGNIGLCLLSGLLVQAGLYNIGIPPQVKHPTIITDTLNLTLVSGVFVATVPVDHIAIGNFDDDAATQKIYKGAIAGAGCIQNDIAYYYIDDVSVTEIVEQLDILGDTVLCIGQSTTLTAQTNTPFWWSTAAAPADTLSLNASITVSPAASTQYILHGVYTTHIVTVQIINPPVVYIGNDFGLCQGYTTSLNASNTGSTYMWNTGETTQTISITESGTYWVKVDNGGCVRADTITITEKPNPPVDLGTDTTFCLSNYDTLVLDGGEAASYKWYPLSDTGRYFGVTAAGIYAVVVTQQNGCTSTDSITAYKNCPPKIFIPNSFTPNGDLKNDVFAPVAEEIIDIKFFIYTRWGQLYYTANGLNASWDGNHNGRIAPHGVYAYLVEYNFYNETGTLVTEKTKGWVALLR